MDTELSRRHFQKLGLGTLAAAPSGKAADPPWPGEG